MRIDRKFTPLLLSIFCSLIIVLLTTPVYSAGPTKTGNEEDKAPAVKSSYRHAVAVNKIKAPKAKIARSGRKALTASKRADLPRVCYYPYWNGTGYSWNSPATSGTASAPAGSSNTMNRAAVDQSMAGVPAVCGNVTYVPSCYSCLPLPAVSGNPWNIPAGGYANNSTVTVNPVQPQSNRQYVVTQQPAASSCSFPVCYGGCLPSWQTAASCY